MSDSHGWLTPDEQAALQYERVIDRWLEEYTPPTPAWVKPPEIVTLEWLLCMEYGRLRDQFVARYFGPRHGVSEKR